MARLSLLPVRTDDALLRAIYLSTPIDGASGVANLIRTLGHSPKLLDTWLAMVWALRFEGVSDRALRELLILRVAQRTGGAYVWAHHRTHALNCGLSPRKIGSLRTWANSPDFDERERAAMAYADAIVDSPEVSEPIFAPLAKVFQETEIVELTLLISFYLHVSRVERALHIEVESAYRYHLSDM